MVTVDLLPYPILIGRGAIARAGRLVRERAAAHRYAIVTDDQVGSFHAAAVREALGAEQSRVYTMPAGESAKTRDTWATITDAMLADRLGRDTTVVALGGGVVGDLAGFVAATFMRGVPVVQIPTSLLAMIDASIGGKTGIDTPTGKNLVGAFHHPAAVIADPDLLRTLPAAHLRAGMAEAIKHGVIADAKYFAAVGESATRIAAGNREEDLSDLVAGSVRIKAAVVAADPREQGLRKVLNFGHTLGHAIEACSDYQLLHGEAIAIGMVLEARLAERLGIAQAGTAETIASALESAGLPTAIPASMQPEAVLAGTKSDKKVRAGRVEYALPVRIGLMSSGDRDWSTGVADADVLATLGT